MIHAETALAAMPSNQSAAPNRPTRSTVRNTHSANVTTTPIPPLIRPRRLNRTAIMATVHCLTGCTIGEILGMVIGTALGWSNWPTVALAVLLAFLFGYAMTLWPLGKAGMAWGTALGLAFASDTLSMTTMEIVDNAIMLVFPGAMDAGIGMPLFWGSLAVSLIVAGVAGFAVNRWLIAKGKGHALVHANHGC